MNSPKNKSREKEKVFSNYLQGLLGDLGGGSRVFLGGNGGNGSHERWVLADSPISPEERRINATLLEMLCGREECWGFKAKGSKHFF
ncbi:hypothetical protein COLO4_12195 [Corchorus olitorius]|uniref:Uncharacterized protein n=1 Tax=Corchorus olitorius TaxID=93759 RepID=A0A1R3K1U1_9ROSI|nr:hypothetical protein COLO4_12195 [Corchorus olitorius]